MYRRLKSRRRHLERVGADSEPVQVVSPRIVGEHGGLSSVIDIGSND